MTDRRRAFSLVELSIVLVIIGLLVGGILAGKTLIKSQNLRNSLQDAKTYAIAMQLFKDKYGALPGDMPDAERIWGNAEGGAATADCASPSTIASTGKATCNGNGNGIIEAAGAEEFRAWQQLAAGDFIAIANLTGIPGSGGATHGVPGTNIPRGSVDGTGFAIASLGVFDSSDSTYFEGDYNNALVFGKATAAARPVDSVLTPQEAYEMDRKVDDGRPGLGYVRVPESGDCVSTTDPQTAQYALSETNQECYLLFLKGFQAKPQ